ncbi:glycosyltransferase family 2 protein [Rhodoglobus sp. NPDC076762]
MTMQELPVTISVALCTHNGATHVAEQLTSILEQVPAPDEIIVSDDASTDDTLAIVRETAAHYPAVQLTVLQNQEPLGVTKNFEQVIRACRGDLIALSDQDDVWYPGRIALFEREFASRPGVALIHSDANLIAADGSSLGHSLSEALGMSANEVAAIHAGDAFRFLLRRNLVTGACTVFRRSLVEYAAPFPSGWVHDEWLGIIASAVSATDILEQPTIGYRQHGANQIGATKLTLVGKFRRMIEPRRARNERIASNMAVLLDRLQRLGARVDREKVEHMLGKVRHEEMRNGLPENRIRRIRTVSTALVAGNYSRFSRGPLDALRDIVQPVD